MRTIHFATAVFAVALLVPTAAVADDIKYSLANTGLDADAQAKARVRSKNNKERFEVKVELLPPGAYAVLVADAPVGTFTVNPEGEGRLRMDGTLGFNPRGQSVKVVGDPGGEVYFSSILPATQEEADLKIKVDESFVAEAAAGTAKGKARYRGHRGKIQFDVKVKGLPAGTYDLYVGGSDVGDLAVVEDLAGETSGALKFDSRFGRGDKLVLTFDPICAQIVVGATVETVTTNLLTIVQFGAAADLCMP